MPLVCKYNGNKVSSDQLIDRITSHVVKKSSKIVMDASVLLANSIKHDTPVLTGRAKQNWVVTVGDVKIEYDPSKSGSEDSKVPVFGYPQGTNYKIYIKNETPYIRVLEHGWSDKSPHGMVTINTSNWQDFVRKASLGDV